MVTEPTRKAGPTKMSRLQRTQVKLMEPKEATNRLRTSHLQQLDQEVEQALVELLKLCPDLRLVTEPRETAVQATLQEHLSRSLNNQVNLR